MMMTMRSMLATMGSGTLAVALAVFTNGCSCFSSCEKTAPEVPAPPVEKAQPPKSAVPAPPAQKKPAETGKTPEKEVVKKPEETKTAVMKPVQEKISVLAPRMSTVWTLELDSLKGTMKSWEEPAKNITLIYDPEKKQIAGCAGVNRYFGPVTIDEKKGIFKTGALGATKMAGPGMQYEDLYLRLLSKVDSYLIKDGKLFLKSGKDTLAVFTTEVKETR